MAGTQQIERFLIALSSQKGFSANTLSAYSIDLNQFADYLRAGQGSLATPITDWSQVTRDTIMSFVLYLKDRGYAPTTVVRKLAAIKSFFKYLHTNKIVPTNPAEEMASMHVDRVLPHTISSSEADLLIERLNAATDSPEVLRDRAMMQLLYATGLRVGEMVALNVGDVDLQEGMVATSGRGGKSRKVPIGSQAGIEALREYLEVGRPILARMAGHGATLAGNSDDRQSLFLNHRGQRLTRQGFWLILKRYARSAGLNDVTPHTLRHSFAAQKLNAGADMRDLQRMLGHASISTTQVYAHLGQRGKRKAGKSDARRGRRKAVSS